MRKKRKVSTVKKILIDEKSLEESVKKLRSSPLLEFRIALVGLLDAKSVRFYVVKQRRIEPVVENQWKNLNGIQKVAYVLQQTKYDHKLMSSIFSNTGGSSSYIRAHPLQAILRKINPTTIETLYRKHIKQEETNIETMRNDLIMKFYGKKTSLERRKLEKENIEEMGNFMAQDEFRFVEVCEITIPIEILSEIFLYLPYVSTTLYNVGGVCKTFYLLLMTTWDELVLSFKTIVKNVSLLTLHNVKGLKINHRSGWFASGDYGKTDAKDLSSSLDYVIRNMVTNKRLRRINFKTLAIEMESCIQIFEKAKKNQPDLFSNVKELEIHTTFNGQLPQSLFPNLSSLVFHPKSAPVQKYNIYSILSEDNFENLRELSVHFSLLFLNPKLMNVKRGNLLSNLHTLKAIDIKDPLTYHLHLKRVINASDKLRELCIFFNFWKIPLHEHSESMNSSFTFPSNGQLKKLSIFCVTCVSVRWYSNQSRERTVNVDYPKQLKLDELIILPENIGGVHRENTFWKHMRIDFCLETILEQRFLHNCIIPNMFIDVPLLSNRYNWKKLEWMTGTWYERNRYSFFGSFFCGNKEETHEEKEEREKLNKEKLLEAKKQFRILVIPMIHSLLELLISRETVHKFRNLEIKTEAFGYFKKQFLKIRMKRSLLSGFGILNIDVTNQILKSQNYYRSLYPCPLRFGECLFQYDISKEDDWSEMILLKSRENSSYSHQLVLLIVHLIIFSDDYLEKMMRNCFNMIRFDFDLQKDQKDKYFERVEERFGKVCNEMKWKLETNRDSRNVSRNIFFEMTDEKWL